MNTLGRTRIPDTVPRPVLVVARTHLVYSYRHPGAVRGVIVLSGRRRAGRRPRRPVLGGLVLAALTVAATSIVRSSSPADAWIPVAIGVGLVVVGAGLVLAGWSRAARRVAGPGSFIVVGPDHRLDLEAIDRVTATWSDRERLETLERAGRDPRWARWTAEGMRERGEDGHVRPS